MIIYIYYIMYLFYYIYNDIHTYMYIYTQYIQDWSLLDVTRSEKRHDPP